jgi:hypothetical protein
MYMYRFLCLLALLVATTSMIKPWQCKDLRLECWQRNRPSMGPIEPGTFGQCGTGWLNLNCEPCAHELARAKAVCKAKNCDHGGLGYMYNSDKTGPHLIIDKKNTW